jgi:hypothetical protein
VIAVSKINGNGQKRGRALSFLRGLKLNTTCQSLHLGQTEDIELKSALKRGMRVLRIAGRKQWSKFVEDQFPKTQYLAMFKT